MDCEPTYHGYRYPPRNDVMDNKPLTDLVPEAAHRFTQPEEADAVLREVCGKHPDIAEFHVLGKSGEDRPITGILLGRGPRRGVLIAGAHPDEPVGPETLRCLVPGLLENRSRYRWLLDGWRLAILPHINPDGEFRNRRWIARWPSAQDYIDGGHRESPREDVEFGFPGKRYENQIAARFFRRLAPLHLHMSLHGMGFAQGALLLIENHWADRTRDLRRSFAAAVCKAGLPFHDHNRRGEKGFHYLGPGFSTAPTSRAMQSFFNGQGENMIARHFQLSSFEFARTLGGNPLCLVTEIPLFLLDRKPGDTAVNPASYLTFRERLPELALRVHTGQSIAGLLEDFGVRDVPLQLGIRLQLTAIDLALTLRSRRTGEVP